MTLGLTAPSYAAVTKQAVIAWGYNGDAQVGDGTTGNQPIAVDITNSGALSGKTITQLSAGGDHTLALCSDGTVVAWGANGFGQVGDGSGTSQTLPIAITNKGALNGKTVIQIAAGSQHNVALCSDGTIVTWGINFNGELGDGTNMSRYVPISITGKGALSGKTVKKIVVGSGHSLAYCSDGTWVAWGKNYSGQVGNGTMGQQQPLPVAITNSGALNGKTIAQLVTRTDNNLALCTDGTVVAWGYNGYGQLGDGTTTNRSVPVNITNQGVLSGKTVTKLIAGGYHSLALCSDGSLVSWGSNGYGELGDGTKVNRTVPINITGNGALNGKTIAQIVAGLGFNLALCTDNTLIAWGGNGSGQLADGNFVDKAIPQVLAGRGALGGKIINQLVAYQHVLALTTYVPIPIAVTGLASRVTTTSATLGGLINPSGEGTTAKFEYGLTSAYGNEKAVTLSPNNGTANQNVFTTLSGLTPQVTYHYRVSATNIAGTSVGSDATFTTLATNSPSTPNQVVTAWGNNQSGQLGEGSLVDKTRPVDITRRGILNGKNVIQLVAGGRHSLALCSDGTVAAWGQNYYGELGNGNVADEALPIDITNSGSLNGKTVVQLAAGGNQSFAICSDGTLAAWGRNDYGQLGDGTTTERHVPVTITNSGVLNGKFVTQIVAGQSHSVALCSDGTLAAWGSNTVGQLGDGTYIPNQGYYYRSVPLDITNSGALSGKTVTQLAAGVGHTLALCSDKTVVAWGNNDYGQLGIGNTTAKSSPVVISTSGVLSGKTVTQIAVGSYHSLALCSDGSVAAWGLNNSGQLGNGSSVNTLSPIAITSNGDLGGRTATRLVAGAYYSLALCGDGAVAAWGQNYNGQLGNGTITNKPLPSLISGLNGKTSTQLVAGDSHTLALATFTSVPTTVVTHPAANVTSTSATMVALINPGTGPTTAQFEYGLTTDYGSVQSVTLSPDSSVIEQPVRATLSDLLPSTTYHFRASASNASGAVLGGDVTFTTLPPPISGAVQTVLAWGNNISGQLGDGTATSRAVPIEITGLGALHSKTITQLLAGNNHSMALCSDGTVAAWGDNTYGQLGDGTTTSQVLPIAINNNGVLNGKTVILLATGARHSLALCSDGTLSAWGSNSSGQLGDGTSVSKLLPVAITGMGALNGKTVTQLGAGVTHSVALCSDGTVAAWGNNSRYQVGNGSGASTKVPMQLSSALGGKTVTQIAVGQDHNLALCSDGTVAVWGYNNFGQLGFGHTSNIGAPVAITNKGALLDRIVTKIAAGGNHSLALCSDGSVAAWGDNQYGQVGDGGISNPLLPVIITTQGLLSEKVVTQVVAGTNHTLALCSDGTVVGWGQNTSSQLGNYGTTNQIVPVAISDSGALKANSVTKLVAGSEHSLALAQGAPTPRAITGTATDITNHSATLNAVVNPNGSPLTVKFDYGLTSAYGNEKTVVLSPNDGTIDQNVAATVSDLSARTTYHFRVSVTNGAISRVGQDAVFTTINGLPQIANGGLSAMRYGTTAFTSSNLGATDTDGDTLTFTLVTSPTNGTLKRSGASLTSGSTFTPADISAGNLTYNHIRGESDSFDFSLSDGYSATPGTLTITITDPSNQVVLAWGGNSAGQLGTGNTTNAQLPTEITGQGALAGKTITQLGAGASHSVALCSDGTLAAWGDGQNGRLGNGTVTSQSIPGAVAVSGALSGKTVTQIAVGGLHNLALCSDGTLVAWGNNIFGQLGDGTTSDALLPVNITGKGVLGGKTIVKIAAGQYHSLALCSDGTLATWGYNLYGQLGNGNGGSSANQTLPIDITGKGALAGKTVSQIDAGFAHNLALCSDGTLATWGYNNLGQLGDGTFTNQSLPLAITSKGVLTGKTVTQFAAGLYHNLALCSDGTVASWGSNIYGQLGNGNRSNKTLPVAITKIGVLNGKTVSQLVAAGQHSLALCTDNTVASWGDNSAGQLGTGSSAYQVLPTNINEQGDLVGKTVTQIVGGDTHTLALATASKALTVVTGPATNVSTTSATLGALINPNGSTTTAKFEYGLTADYGSEQNITLSPNNGTTEQSVTATITGLKARTTYHYRVRASNNYFTRVGEDATFTTSNSLPEIVKSSLTVAIHGVIPISASNLSATDADGDALTFTLLSLPTQGVLKRSGVALATGDTFTPADISNRTLTYTYLKSSSSTSPDSFDFNVSDGIATVPGTLAITFTDASGQVFIGWGANNYGQLGNGITANQALPLGIEGRGALIGKKVIRLAIGDYHTLALCSDGTIAAWGLNDKGQIGDGTTVNQSIPVAITGKGALSGKTVTGIVAGFKHSLALCSDGSVVAWGDNQYGEIGNGNLTNQLLPIAITSNGALSGKTVTKLVAGQTHNFALCSDGSLIAWGDNSTGQIGDGTTAIKTLPVNITNQGALNGKTVSQVAGGGSHTLALCSDGTVVAWGDGSYGQIGDGAYSNRSLPTNISTSGALNGKTVVQITAGAYHSLALCSDGTVVTWGYNGNGQLGDGTNNYYKPIPAAITDNGALTGKTVTQLIAGRYYSLARCSNGTIAAWGSNNSGQLGDGTTTQRTLPVTISDKGDLNGSVVTDIVAGNSHSLALSMYVPAPTVVTGGATNITSIGATLGAIINPNGDTTTAVFEYGLTTAYGSQQTITLSPDNGLIEQTVSASISGLAPHTTYHYRAKATSTGTVVGSDATFTTLNTLPQILSNGLTVRQNTTATLTEDNLTATDADGDALTFTLVKAPTQGALKLNGVALANGGTFTAADISDGKLSYSHTSTSVGNDSFDFRVSDGIITVQGSFAITLQYGPTAIDLSQNSVPEKQAVGTIVGNFSSTDADAGDTFTYSLVTGEGGNGNTSFTIDGANLKTAATFTVATKSSYSIRVQSTDSTGLTFQQQFTITVTPFVDSTIPVVTMSSPILNQKLMIAQFTGNIVTGSASDNLLVSAVKVRLSRKRGTTNYYWNGTDFTTASIYLNATVTASSNATWTLNNLPPASKLDVGLYQVEVYATDNSSNKSVSVVRPFNLLTESIAPTVVVSTPIANQKILLSDLNGSTVSGTASDNVGVIAVKVRFSRKRNNVNQYWNGSDFTTTSATVDAALTGSTEVTWTLGSQTPAVEKLDSGLYQVEVYATDAAGNKSATVLRPFTLGADFVSPSVSISTPTLNQKVDINAFVAGTIQGVADDNLGVTSVKVKLQRKRDTTITYWNGTEFTTTSATLEAAVTSPGSQSVTWSLDNAIPAAKLDAGAYVIYATATDAAGNLTTSASRTFTVSGTASGSAAVSAIKSSAAGS